jgi:uncharacterized protein YbjT (DUF2867 family)
MARRVFITGGTGYIGGALIPLLLEQGHGVRALVRSDSKGKIKADCEICVGNALDAESYKFNIVGCNTFVHLVGVSHPSPAKAREFVSIDRKSAQEAIRVAAQAGVDHFIYLSVAYPAPVMHSYVEVRAECEASLRASGLNATIVRPWYVLGPGHRWPLLLKPFYRAAELIPSMREGALRLGLVNRRQMVGSLAAAVEAPPNGVRVIEVPEIRRLGNGWQREHPHPRSALCIGR